jgi:hypothetical protein
LPCLVYLAAELAMEAVCSPPTCDFNCNNIVVLSGSGLLGRLCGTACTLNFMRAVLQ